MNKYKKRSTKQKISDIIESSLLSILVVIMFALFMNSLVYWLYGRSVYNQLLNEIISLFYK
jgi:hypothetical protein